MAESGRERHAGLALTIPSAFPLLGEKQLGIDRAAESW